MQEDRRLEGFSLVYPLEEASCGSQVEASCHSLCRQSLRLHDIEKDIVRADIALYVSQELKKVPELEDEYGESWPPPEVEKIVEQSDSLFVIAATIVRDICSEAGNPVERLQACGRASKLSGVHELYDGILKRATSELRPPEKDTLRACLSLLVVSFRPLALTEYAALLDRPVHAIQASFKMLHSVIKLPTSRDDNEPISTHHASFVDFLTDVPTIQKPEDNNASSLLPIDKRTAHAMTFKRCLRLMDDPKQGVHLGIPEDVISCKGINVRLIGELKQPLELPPDIAYACMFLLNHYLRGVSQLSDDSKATMMTFVRKKGLYWLQALTAVLKKVGFSDALRLYDVDKDTAGLELGTLAGILGDGLISRVDALHIDQPSCATPERVRTTIAQGDSGTISVMIAYEPVSAVSVMHSTTANGPDCHWDQSVSVMIQNPT
ncbi:hypothetical protein NMY22_g12312 [Coprinellus aureogranulatus]|nr:hypothetical protein NMY22_g12312 [Coprinellus aureogranulatus]